MSTRSKNISLGIIVFYALIYLLLPTANSGGDALGYASAIRDGRDLISPHHLLYNYFIYITHWGIGRWFLDVLAWAKIVNALLAAGCLAAVSGILHQQLPQKMNWPAVLFAGACFGFMRFATENETYIIPLFFSLMGTKLLLAFDKTGRKEYIPNGFLLLAIAVLFHQIHFFWWLGFAMVFGLSFRKAKLPVLLTGLLIMAQYMIFAFISGTSLWKFIVFDATQGQVALVPGIDNLKFTALSLARSFVQLHGYIPVMVARNPFLYNVIAIAGLGLIMAIYIFFSKKRSMKAHSALRFGRRALVLTFILQFLFAFYSVGNAEFMVMLPFLFLLWMWLSFDQKPRAWLYAGIALLVWNVGFGLAPLRFINFENERDELLMLKKRAGMVFISHDKTKLQNYNEYYRVVPPGTAELIKSPAEIGNDSIFFRIIIDNIFDGRRVYTDCINYPWPTSRAGLLFAKKNNDYFKQWKYFPVDKFRNYYGEVTLNRIVE